MSQMTTAHVFKRWMVCLTVLMLAAAQVCGEETEKERLTKKQEELKKQQAELAGKEAEIGNELRTLQEKLNSRHADLDKSKEIQDLRVKEADAQAAVEQFVKTDAKLVELRQAHEKAQAAVEPMRQKVLGAIDASQVLAKERAELEFKEAMLDCKIREKDFAAEHHVTPRLYSDNQELSAARQKRESVARQMDQARHEAENGSQELKDLRTEMDKARAALDKSYNAAKSSELEGLYKVRAEKESALQALTAETLKDEDKALNEAREKAGKARQEVTGKDKEAIALTDKIAQLHKQRAEIEYQISLADFQLRDGVARRMGYDPEVVKAESDVRQAEGARWNKETGAAALVAARGELDGLRRQIGEMEAAPNTLPEVAAARTAWQQKETAFNTLRGQLHAKAVGGQQAAYEEAAKAEETLRTAKLAADEEMVGLSREKAEFAKERGTGSERRQQIDGELRAMYEKTLEDEQVKAAKEAVTAAGNAYNEAYAASEVTKLQEAVRDASKAMNDKIAELRQGDADCTMLNIQIAGVQQKAGEIGAQVQGVLKDLDDTAFQVIALGLKPAKIDKANVVNGLVLKCFEGQDNMPLDFEKSKPVKILKADAVDLALKTRDADIGMVFEGYIEIPKDGEYTFSLASDDGSFLYLAGQEVINNGGSHGVVEKSRKLSLSAGMHAIRVTYFQGTGGLDLVFKWSGPEIEAQVVPGSILYMAKEDLPQPEPAK